MRLTRPIRLLSLAVGVLIVLVLPKLVSAFEGRVQAVTTQGNETNALQYTVGPDHLRIEVTSTNWPNPIDIVELKSGALTLVFPHNRSFVRLKPNGENAAPPVPGGLPPGIDLQPTAAPAAPREMARQPMSGGLPPGIGPQSTATLGVSTIPEMPAMPPMPMPRMRPDERMELKASGNTTNILGLACGRYELKQRGETLEVWATDKLFVFQPYVRNQPHRFGPRMIEEQWPAMLTSRKLFPLLVSLRYDNGAERYRFEVNSVRTEKITDPNKQLFQPPSDYHEIQPLPF